MPGAGEHLIVPVSPGRAYCVSDKIISRVVEGELILVPLTSGIGDLEDELYTINETGRAI